MGLSSSDHMPVGISLKDAYVKIRDWYQSNIVIAPSSSVSLISFLPDVSNLTELEIRAVLGEIIYGNLEWAFHKDDGDYKMADYAIAALNSGGYDNTLSQNDRNKLKPSPLWPYLIISNK